MPASIVPVAHNPQLHPGQVLDHQGPSRCDRIGGRLEGFFSDTSFKSFAKTLGVALLGAGALAWASVGRRANASAEFIRDDDITGFTDSGFYNGHVETHYHPAAGFSESPDARAKQILAVMELSYVTSIMTIAALAIKVRVLVLQHRRQAALVAAQAANVNPVNQAAPGQAAAANQDQEGDIEMGAVAAQHAAG